MKCYEKDVMTLAGPTQWGMRRVLSADPKYKGPIIRQRYEATCKGYDELYRAEQYEKYMETLKRVKPRGLVLDAGCGTGLLLEYMTAYHGLDGVRGYVCLDYSPCMLKIATWRMKLYCRGISCTAILGNVERLPLSPRSFDVIYSFTVLDLVDDIPGSLQGLVRASRGPVVVSMLKKLPYKDVLLEAGARVIGVTSKDVIFLVTQEVVKRVAQRDKSGDRR